MLDHYVKTHAEKSYLDRFPLHILHPECVYRSVILDVGSGFCNDLAWAASMKAGLCVGIDLRAWSSRVSIIGDGVSLPLEDSSFDIIVLNNVIHCIRNSRTVSLLLKEARRVCRGVLVGRVIADELTGVEPTSEFEKQNLDAILRGELVGFSRSHLLSAMGTAGFNSCITYLKEDRKPWRTIFFRAEVL